MYYVSREIIIILSSEFSSVKDSDISTVAFLEMILLNIARIFADDRQLIDSQPWLLDWIDQTRFQPYNYLKVKYPNH